MGSVSEIAKNPDQAVWLSTSRKVYKVTVAIDGEDTNLKPGMSAQAAIALGELPRIPASAVLGKGKESFCYVLVDKELRVRKVTVGISDGKLTEIQDGLKEGESVLRNPRAVVERLK